MSPDTPAILGMDFAGTVGAVGEGVEDYSIGDESGGLKPVLMIIVFLLKKLDKRTLAWKVDKRWARWLSKTTDRRNGS